MIVGCGDRVVHHSVRTSFGHLLRCALNGTDVYVAHGPIYDNDPAAELLSTFLRSAREVGIDPDMLSEQELATQQVIDRAARLRTDYVRSWDDEALDRDWDDVRDWTRAGLVLEVAARRGVPMRDGSRPYVRWKLRGTMTGRFGVESGGFNPLVIPKGSRREIVPGYGRSVVVIDFRAIDLCSMLSLTPGLRERYEGTTDLHSRTAEITGLDRDVAKRELFVYAYGGNSPHVQTFGRLLPELKWIRGTSSEEARANAQLVQKTSATAFKAALSRALPLLVDDPVRPMFTVHDELTLDVLNEALSGVGSVTKALEEGASERIGVPYTTGMTVGKTYAEAKDG